MRRGCWPDRLPRQRRPGGEEGQSRATCISALSAIGGGGSLAWGSTTLARFLVRLTVSLPGKAMTGIVASMRTVAITAKRQATLPAVLCEELGVGPGERIILERRVIDGETVWILRGRKPDWSWVGAARRYGEGKSHRWKDVRRSIARG